MVKLATTILTTSFLALASLGWSYPLDGTTFTGIVRLQAYTLAQQKKLPGHQLPDGSLLTLDAVDLRLVNRSASNVPEPDPDFTRSVVDLLGTHADRYQLAVLDLSDPDHVRYAEHRGDVTMNPGSVGKLLVALALFHALAEIYPVDISARVHVLRNAQVTADDFILTDHHKVPFWKPGYRYIRHRPVKTGDTASLWTYLDWMISASSNAAASMVIREVLLLKQFGRNYPVSAPDATGFFKRHPRKALSALLSQCLQNPVAANGLDLDLLRQGGFFTWKGKQKIAGTSSRASVRMLLQFLLKMEQGRLVDPFSSREIKRLMYNTQRRIRYASAPALYDAAVYFKSGSLYKCQPEPGFKCGKYKGNKLNMLNSVAIIESPANNPEYFYMVVVMSNVLRVNSAVAHQTLATRIHRLIAKPKHQSGQVATQTVNRYVGSANAVND